MRGFRIAIVGATGLVGQKIMEVLQERGIIVDVLVPLASEASGRTVNFQGHTLKVEPVAEMDWGRVDVAFFAAGNAVSESYVDAAMSSGVTVIDKSSRFRMEKRVPLVVPQVNGDDIGEALLIASPNCSTIQLVIALAPIEREFGVERVIVSTYQAVSGTGRDAVEELRTQTEQRMHGQPLTPQVYSEPIAHNTLPYCDVFLESDYTGEEWKLVRETAKIFGHDVRVTATAVRVPIYVGHAESVYLETRRPFSLEQLRTALAEAPAVRLVDDPQSGQVPTALMAEGQDDVLVGRIRQDLYHSQAVNLFVVADNLRRGAATNAIDIMLTIKGRWRL